MIILIANNRADNAQNLRSHLLKDGFEVVATNNYAEAAFKVNELLPDLIVADISAKAAAFSLINTVKTNKGYAQIPIIVLGDLGMEDMVEEACDLGADDFVTHPYKYDELSLRINLLTRFKTAKAVA